jgi:XRE family aerobic/anaerobic benzoate catabolism transcriptional regulator
LAPHELLARAAERPVDEQPIALLGLRGAGKSAVGRRLAKELGVGFVELDAEVERDAGLSVGEIFELHGEASFRRREREALRRILAQGDRVVLATGGGLVTEPESFELVHRHCRSVWLRATPEEHWRAGGRAGGFAADGGESPGVRGLMRDFGGARAAL